MVTGTCKISILKEIFPVLFPVIASVRHRRKRTASLSDLRKLEEEYDLLLRDVNSGTSLEAACRSLGINRSGFYRRRHIVEMKKIDPVVFLALRDSLRDTHTVQEFNQKCKDRLLGTPLLKERYISFKRRRELIN